jgi:cytidyltransferase-like protein
MNTGIFLARFQPLHKSHEFLIRKSIEENEITYVLIGSADKSRQPRNPFNISERQNMLRQVFSKEIKEDKLILVPFSDYSDENDVENVEKWGSYLYDNITNIIQQSDFSLYYSDKPEIMLSWFNDKQKETINFRFFNRENIFASLSATKIRKAILNDDDEYLLKHLPMEVYKMKDVLKKILSEI